MATDTSGIGEIIEVQKQDYTGKGLKEYNFPDEGVYFYFLIADYYTPVEKKYSPVVNTGIKPDTPDWYLSFAHEGIEKISGFLWRIG